MAVKLTEEQMETKTRTAQDFICAAESLVLTERTRRDLIAAAMFELADVRDSLARDLR